MRRVLVAVMLFAVCVAGAEKRKKSPKPPDVQVMEGKARREEGTVKLDGRVRNSGEKSIKGLTVIFDFMTAERAVITSQKTEIDEPVLEPGNDAVFRAVLVDPVRAVYFQIRAEDSGEKELRVANAGPFPIE